MRNRVTILLLLMGVLAGCRGQVSEDPPIRLERNMFNQPEYWPQSTNPFFADGRADRSPIPGTVSQQGLKLNTVFFEGKNPDGSWVVRAPLPATPEERLALLKRGQERFNIYCTPCHDRTGSGNGMVISRIKQQQIPGFPPPPNYNDDRIRLMPDGQIFDVITHGVRTMPAYRHQIPEADRWAIIAYIHALQRSQQTTLRDVPGEIVKTLEERP